MMITGDLLLSVVQDTCIVWISSIRLLVTDPISINVFPVRVLQIRSSVIDMISSDLDRRESDFTLHVLNI